MNYYYFGAFAADLTATHGRFQIRANSRVAISKVRKLGCRQVLEDGVVRWKEPSPKSAYTLRQALFLEIDHVVIGWQMLGR